MQVKGLPHQCSITSLQETPGSSRNPRLPCLLWVLQKPLSSLGISEPLRHLQSSSSTPVSLQALHCCSSCPSCHLSQLQGCGHGAWGRQHSRRSEGVSVPFFPLLVLLLREWFQAPDGKTCHTLQAALEILHLWFSCCSAGHCRVPLCSASMGKSQVAVAFPVSSHRGDGERALFLPPQRLLAFSLLPEWIWTLVSL